MIIIKKGREDVQGEYLVSTGRIIKDYLDEYNINQKILASRTGMSEKHISNVLNSNSRLTEEFALKLEKVIPNVGASYWLKYEAKYREYLARQEEFKNISKIDLSTISKRFRFKEVFKGLELNIVEQAIEMMKLLKISDFGQFDNAYSELSIDFLEDGGEKEAIAIWLNLCESEIEIQNSILNEKKYNKDGLEEELEKFKMLSSNEDTEKSLISCKKLCNRLGIYLVICEAITNSKVRGALTTYKGHPAIYISGRFKSHSHIWFAIMHELSHLILHYNKKEMLISLEDNQNEREKEANYFARSIIVSNEAYKTFVETGSFTKEKILTFADEQQVLPCFVIAFLKHDRLIEYNQFSYI